MFYFDQNTKKINIAKNYYKLK